MVKGLQIFCLFIRCNYGFGTHFSDQITGRENLFAPNAKKYAFDIDQGV